MIVNANPPASYLNRLAWAVFWRVTVLGTVVSFAIGLAFGFLGAVIYLIVSGGDRGDPPAIYNFIQDAMIVIGSLVANFLILRWAIRSRLGQVVQEHTLIVAAVNTGKDTSNAN